MTDLAFLLPLLPLAIPLGGACLLAMAPSRWVNGVRRRWCYLALLILSGVAVAIVSPVGITYWHSRAVPMIAAGEPLSFGWDVHALRFGALLLGTFVCVGLSRTVEPVGRLEASALLTLVGASLGFSASANVWTCSLLWGLSDLALTCIRSVQISADSGRRAVWNTWGGLLSTGLMVAGGVILSSQQGHTALAALGDSPLAAALLMGAAITRMVFPPLSGGIRLHWETYLVSVWTGSSLWLRLAAQSPFSPNPAGLAAGAVALIVPAMMASLMPDLVTALPYIVLHSLAIAILAPVIVPLQGTIVALVIVLDLSLVMALVCVNDSLKPVAPLGRWVRVPFGWGVASLMGLPLTLGFVTHWTFLRLCLEARMGALAFWGSLSCLLVSVPSWQRLIALRHSEEQVQPAPRFPQWAAVAGAAALLAALVIGSVAPGLIAGLWGATPGLVKASSLGGMLYGEGRLIGTLCYTALLGPLVGGLCVQRWLGHITPLAHRPLRVLRGALLLDWLVVLVEEGLTRMQGLLDRALRTIEGPFCLGWSLLWVVSIALFLAESQA